VLLRSWFWLQGQVLVQVEGQERERLLNQCLARGIYLWDIRWKGNKLYFRLLSQDFFLLRPLVRGLRAKVSIEEKIGFPFFWRRFKRRRTLALGSLLFVMIIYVWSSFIWSVKVEGINHPEQQRRLNQLLIDQGIMPGVLRQRVDPSLVEHEVMTQFPELAWARAYFTGTIFILEVVPKLRQPELMQPNHLVAGRGGVVLDVLVLAGKALVDQGDSVQAGDVLILGEQSRRPVSAKGRVLAQVWHETYCEGEAVREYLVRSGTVACRKMVRFLGWELIMSGVKEVPFPQFELEQKRKCLLPWRKSSGLVEVIDETYHELEGKRTPIPESDCAQQLLERALAQAKRKLGEGSKIIDIDNKILSQPGDIPVRVRVRIEAVEDIAVPIPYYPRASEGGIGIGGASGEESSSSRS
jgi:similar to stage IV sporulation protein